MYAQLFYISEEGNHYPQTERLLIDDSLEGLLIITEEQEYNNAYWEYYHLSEKEAAIYGGYSIVDFNSKI